MSAGTQSPTARRTHGTANSDTAPSTGVQRVGGAPISLGELLSLARGDTVPWLDDAPAYRARLAAARQAVADALAAGRAIYGVTTGVGASVSNRVDSEHRSSFGEYLFRFHGCGTGRILGETEAAAVVAVRLVTLARGYSGVRDEVLEGLCHLLEHRLLPRIPEEGSVGASGDLTPLSYVAATLAGEREATYQGEVLPSAEALARAGLSPLDLQPKETLSLMNGTSMMTALACLAIERSQRLARLAAAITATLVDVTHGNRAHFDPRIFALKPHPGQTRAASWIREALGSPEPAPTPARLQDRYSLRCAPHVIGVLVDALIQTERTVAIELNGVDDNPIVVPEDGDILHGGNFYGGHIAFAMDGLKAAVANVADLLDRQLILLCMPETSDGLPANLVGISGDGASVHHGFKAMQITASALAAEALKGSIPASIFSRSTESHNQDKVSMGTIAARDCLRVLELSETVAAVGLLAACQGVDLRGDEDHPVAVRALRDAVRKHVPSVTTDRRQDLDIERIVALLRTGALALGEFGEPDESVA